MSEDKEPQQGRRRRRPRRRSGGKAGAPREPGGDAPARDDGAPRPEGEARAEGSRRGRSSRGGRGGQQRGSGQRGNGQRGRNRPRSRGRPTRGKPRRTRTAENWWAQRWIHVLESFEVGRRLGRGRSYARQGQVSELELEKGSVTALVQGSRDAPYLVRMRLSMLSSTDWKKVTRAIAEDEELTHALVSGQIPENIEEAFEPLGLSLFPTASGDLKTACSCPDQANPCKHIAAVYYLLGEEFDRDPFLVFRLRGIDRNEIIEAIGGPAALRGAPVPAPAPPPEMVADSEARAAAADRAAAGDEPEPEAPPIERAPEPLPTESHGFWAGEAGSEEPGGEVRIPATVGALVKRLGGYVFWRGHEDCAAVVDRAYRNGSIAGFDVYLGETETLDG